MGKYLKNFSTDPERVEYEGSESYIEPYVSYVKGDNTVHYNKPETRLVCKFYVEDASEPVMILSDWDDISLYSAKVEIDDGTVIEGSELSGYGLEHTFDTAGEHTVLYTLLDQTKVSDYMLAECPITSVIIPNSVTSIGDDAFYGCNSLLSIVVDSNNAVYDSRDNCNAIIETATNTLISGCKNTIIPNSVTSIGDDAFADCSGLTSITIPNSVTSIGYHAFNFAGLTNVTIPDSVITIGIEAFGHCSGLTSVTIGSGVTSMERFAFGNCKSLTSVTISKGITSISYCAFCNCESLTSVTIPDSVTSIGESAFGGCSSLTNVTIPDSVTSINNRAFHKCTGLTSITSLATTAPTINSGTFEDVKTNGTLTVPSGSNGYDVWMGTGNYYLGKYGWTKVEQ